MKENCIEIDAGFGLSPISTANFSLQALNGEGYTEYEAPDYEIYGGLMDIELHRSGTREFYRGKPFWNATVRLEGQRPRAPIQLLIDQVNSEIKRKKILVFEDLAYRPPLSIVGSRFVPESRLHPQDR